MADRCSHNEQKRKSLARLVSASESVSAVSYGVEQWGGARGGCSSVRGRLAGSIILVAVGTLRQANNYDESNKRSSTLLRHVIELSIGSRNEASDPRRALPCATAAAIVIGPDAGYTPTWQSASTPARINMRGTILIGNNNMTHTQRQHSFVT